MDLEIRQPEGRMASVFSSVDEGLDQDPLWHRDSLRVRLTCVPTLYSSGVSLQDKEMGVRGMG